MSARKRRIQPTNTRFLLKNLLLFLIPSFVPLLILSLTTMLAVYGFLLTESDDNNLNMLKQTRTTLENTFNALERLSINISANSHISVKLKNVLRHDWMTYERYLDYKIVHNYFQTQLSMNPQISNIYFYLDKPHKRFYHSEKGLINLDYHYSREWLDFYLAHSQNMVWGDTPLIYAEKGPNEGTITIYKDIYHFYGSQKGVLAVSFYKSYIRSVLNDIQASGFKAVAVIDEHGSIIACDRNFDRLLAQEGIQQNGTCFDLSGIGGEYLITQIQSVSYGWQYVSIEPKSSVYRLPYMLMLLMLAVLLVSLIIGFLLALRMTRRYQKSIRGVMDILDGSVTENEAVPSTLDVADEFDYIIRNIISIFVRQNYLKIQLSEKRYRLQVIELIALQAQINPHFLQNTLQNIYLQTLGLAGREHPVSHMLEQLIVVMRYSLSHPAEMVVLDEEIKNVRAYIELEKCQYGMRLSVDWNIDADIHTVELPKMLIQPLVENCIRHGMRSDSSPLRIRVRIYERAEHIVIQVSDNGNGIPTHRLSEIRSQLANDKADADTWVPDTHIGLFNSAKRLLLAYQGKASIRVFSLYHCGTSVCVRLPLPLRHDKTNL